MKGNIYIQDVCQSRRMRVHDMYKTNKVVVIEQINKSILTLTGVSLRSQRLNVQPHIRPTLSQRLIITSISQIPNFHLIWLQIGSNYNFNIRFDHLLEWLTELRNLPLLTYYKDILQDTKQLPAEEIYRTSSERVPVPVASIPREFGVCHSPNTWVCYCSATQKFSKSHT